LDESTVTVVSLNSFKNRLNKIQQQWIGFLWTHSGRLTQSPQQFSFPPGVAAPGELPGHFNYVSDVSPHSWCCYRLVIVNICK